MLHPRTVKSMEQVIMALGWERVRDGLSYQDAWMSPAGLVVTSVIAACRVEVKYLRAAFPELAKALVAAPLN